MGTPLTHADLVAAAATFLQRKRCALFITEPGGHHLQPGDEIPDAIGFRHDGTTLVVEAKATRADFMAERRKVHRAGTGLGHLRYYIVPEGLSVYAEEVPYGWGLLFAKAAPMGLRVRVGAEPVWRSEQNERLALRIAIHLGRQACDYNPAALLAKIHDARAAERVRAAGVRAEEKARKAMRREAEALRERTPSEGDGDSDGPMSEAALAAFFASNSRQP